MNLVNFASTDELVSPVALGCMLMGTATDQDTSFQLLDRFVATGGNFLDTANCYAWWIGAGENVGDESETLLGTWMRRRRNRDQLFVATKVGARLVDPAAVRDPEGGIVGDRIDGQYELLAPATVRAAVEGSMRRLGIERIDLLYTHIDDHTTALEDTLGTLDTLVAEGLVGHVAASNMRARRFARARAIQAANGWAPYRAIQQQHSLLTPNPDADFGVGVHVDAELLDYLDGAADVQLIAYSPLLKGVYGDETKRDSSPLWPLFDNAENRQRLARLHQLARELSISTHQLVLATLAHQRPRVIPVVAASNLEQLDENLAAIDLDVDIDVEALTIAR